uniref:Calcium-transporting ATPase n=1 Tax=Rhizophora mucronata TaxID=61149 RepID=A0A2P2N0M9_RHIMU
MITWNATVETITPENIQLSNKPLNTLIFSISRLFISLNT